MSERLGERIVGVVAQQPFEAGEQQNLFCNLKPLLVDHDKPALAEEFPNNGLVWWLVRPQVRSMVQPGRLFTGILEESRIQFDKHDASKSLYQVNVNSAEPVRQDDLLEILTLPSGDISSVRDILNRKDLATTDHPVAATVLARWRGHLYGPLRAISRPSDQASNRYLVTFENPSTDQTVLEIPESELDNIAPRTARIIETDVSSDNNAPDRTQNSTTCRYEILFEGQYRALSARGLRISLASHVDVLRSAAKTILSRKQRQELSKLLAELEESLLSADAGLRDQVTESLAALSETIARDNQLSDLLSQSLLASGLLDESIDRGIEERAQLHLEQRAATIQGELAKKTRTAQTEFEEAENQLKALNEKLRRERVSMRRDLESERSEILEAIAKEQAHLADQKSKLEEQRRIISDHLESVTRRFTDSRDEVLNQFLELLPLLSESKILQFPGTVGSHATGITPIEAPPSRSQSKFELPEFVSRPTESTPSVTDETEFFERFIEHVEGSGFSYRRIDLISFHISLKCSDLTILGGVSGTGKSTLPRLYAEALAGSDAPRPGRYHFVGVSPAWLDTRDLLGHVNTLDRVFHPAPNGLFQQLILAQEEFRLHGPRSGLYLMSLDEMNLSHVEHYFSGFLQELEQESDRSIRVFSPENVSKDSAFAQWPILELPKTLRFIGTVNFDETTKQLSLRVLDRANMIELRPGKLPDISLGSSGLPRPAVPGPMVDLDSYSKWARRGAGSTEVDELMDQLREPLAILGCPLSPRRYRAIDAFIASSQGLCTQEKAFDLQISQRILPQVRGLFRREAREALDRFQSILRQRDSDYEESLNHIGRLMLEERGASLFVDE